MASCCLHSLNQGTSNDLEQSEESLGVIWECSTDADCREAAVSVSFFEPTIGYIAERWPRLAPHSGGGWFANIDGQIQLIGLTAFGRGNFTTTGIIRPAAYQEWIAEYVPLTQMPESIRGRILQEFDGETRQTNRWIEFAVSKKKLPSVADWQSQETKRQGKTGSG